MDSLGNIWKHIYLGSRNRSALWLLIIVHCTNTLTYSLTYVYSDAAVHSGVGKTPVRFSSVHALWTSLCAHDVPRLVRQLLLMVVSGLGELDRQRILQAIEQSVPLDWTPINCYVFARSQTQAASVSNQTRSAAKDCIIWLNYLDPIHNFQHILTPGRTDHLSDICPVTANFCLWPWPSNFT